MIDFTSDAVYIGSFPIFYYGIILMLGVVGAAFLGQNEVIRKKMNVEFLWDSLIWMIIGGVIGARLWHILTPPPSMVARGIDFLYYLRNPLDALNFRAGGLGIPGAVVGGVLALYWYSKRKNENFIKWLDIVAAPIALGQAIGRWGNFINQELYGAPSDLPWAIFIKAQNRLAEYANIEYYHPLFLYESLLNLLNMGLILFIARKYDKKLIPGDLFLVYLLGYPLIRFGLDFIRLDASEVAGINANQSLMAVLFVVSLGLMIKRHSGGKNKKKKSK